MPLPYETIRLSQEAVTVGPDGGRTRTESFGIDILAEPVEAASVRREVEATLVFDYDIEFHVRRLPSIENVDTKWKLRARGGDWQIVRVRRFPAAGGSRDRMLGIQAKRPQ